MRTPLRAAFLRAAAIAFTLAAGQAQAADGAPQAVELIFGRKHLENAETGSELTYRFERAIPEAARFGGTFAFEAPFTDTLKVAAVAGPSGAREIAVQIFTGARARAPIVSTNVEANPLLIFFLDRSVHNFAALTGASWPYLKSVVRAALRDKASTEAVPVQTGRGEAPGYRISVTPFTGDPHMSKMRGYENARLIFVLSEHVPGGVAELSSLFESRDPNLPKIEERIRFVEKAVVPAKDGAVQ